MARIEQLQIDLVDMLYEREGLQLAAAYNTGDKLIGLGQNELQTEFRVDEVIDNKLTNTQTFETFDEANTAFEGYING